jgi:2-keto-4-pentenoate hydratase
MVLQNTADDRLRTWADRLYAAEQDRVTIRQLTSEDPDLSIEAAYRIQMHNVQRKLERGDKVVGHKIGLTSKPMQNLLGVGEPDYGHLMASMQFQSGDVIDFPLIQPKVEPELAFVLKKDLDAPNVGVQDVIQATDYRNCRQPHHRLEDPVGGYCRR